MTGKAGRLTLFAICLTAGLAAHARPAGESIAALGMVQPGQWQLRDAGGPSRAMCVRDPAMLVQLRDRGAGCTRRVTDNAPSNATVHYTCPGAGHGRTTIAVETPRLVRIESQGIDGGSPFALDIEARRVGSCPAGS